MGKYEQLNTPDGSKAELSKFSSNVSAGEPLENIEEGSQPSSVFEKEDRVGCGHLGSCPLLMLFLILASAIGIGVGISMALVCSRYVIFTM